MYSILHCNVCQSLTVSLVRFAGFVVGRDGLDQKIWTSCWLLPRRTIADADLWLISRCSKRSKSGNVYKNSKES